MLSSFLPKLGFALTRNITIAVAAFGAVLAVSVPAQAQLINGDKNPNLFSGTLESALQINGRGDYDRINYEGDRSAYGFERSSLATVRVWKRNGEFDYLRNVESVSFGGITYDFDEIFAPTDPERNIIVYHGTTIGNVFPSSLLFPVSYLGERGRDIVEYEGERHDYVFELQDDESVKVTKPFGGIDRLQSIERISFDGEVGDYAIEDLFPSERVVDPNQLYHFGEPVKLVGANIAWSDNSRFSSDFGASDGFGNPDTNLIGFQAKFDEIAQNGGNSARIWLHTTAQVSPNINTNARTLGLSRELTNEQVIGQLDAVLDAAWDRGILVTFSLFSFDLLCDSHANAFNYTGSMTRHRRMLNGRRQFYFDNALTPMVEGLKDHPALFAYEIFNEPEGMYEDVQFCDSASPINHGIAARFVNEAAAIIHELDPNVKVTSSTHTELFDDFSNATLLSLSGAKPTGTLDFYELHWYEGWGRDPYTTPASFYEADRPVIIGEYDVEQSDATAGIGARDSLSVILNNGYAGGWPWSLATVNNTKDIQKSINDAQQSPINKTAIEACIQDQSPECYIK